MLDYWTFSQNLATRLFTFLVCVFSMVATQVFRFSDALRTKLYMIAGGDFTSCYHKRLCKCSWTILLSVIAKVIVGNVGDIYNHVEDAVFI